MALSTPVPDELRQWRVHNGLTQTKAAEIVGVHERSWRRWENGERSIPKMLTLWITANQGEK